MKRKQALMGSLLVLLIIALAIIFFISRDTDPRLTKEEAVKVYHKIALPADFHLEKELWFGYPAEAIPEQKYGEFTYSTQMSLAEVTEFMAGSLQRAGYKQNLEIKSAVCSQAELDSYQNSHATNPEDCPPIRQTYPGAVTIVAGIHGNYDGNYYADISWMAYENTKNVVKIVLGY